MIPIGRRVPLPVPPMPPAPSAAPAPVTEVALPFVDRSWDVLGQPVRGVDGRYAPLAWRLTQTDTDAFVVVHAGRVVTQWYRTDAARTAPQAIMSITKSIVGCVAGRLIDAGTLDPEAPATRYVPELACGGYGPVRVRDLLDMRVGGLEYHEEYGDPDGELARMAHTVDGSPVGYGLHDLVARIGWPATPGGPFCYRSLDTEALGWVLERAAGTTISALVSELLGLVGATGPVDVAVDLYGTMQSSGGLGMTALDLARFGLMLLRGGAAGDRQVVSAGFIKDTRTGAPDSTAAFAARVQRALAHTDVEIDTLRTGLYRNQFWVPRPAGRALLCLGIHGQYLLVDPDTDCVVVKLSSWRTPQDPGRFSDSLECAGVAAIRMADHDPHPQ